MDAIQSARDIAARLHAAENAIDLAIAETARLTIALTDARSVMNLSAVVGGEALQRTAVLQGGLTAARGEAVSLHDALTVLQARVGLRTAAVGVGDKPPPPPPMARDAQVVEAVAAPVRRLRSA